MDELGELDELTPDQVPDEVTLLDLRVGAARLETHRADFVEFGDSAVLGGTMAGSDWYRTRWHDLDLRDVDLAGARFEESAWQRVSLGDCRLIGLDLAACTVTDVSVRGGVADDVSLRQTTIARTHLHGVRMAGVDLSGARLTDVTFTDCDLTGASLDQARLVRVRFDGCVLERINGVTALRGATIGTDDPAGLGVQLAAALGITLEL